MNPNFLFPVGLVLGLVLMGLTGASKPFARIDLWLDNHDAPVTAQANAQSPVIDCLNRVDVHWRVAYALYQRPQNPADPTGAWEANQHDFNDNGPWNVGYVQKDICSAKISEKLNLLQYDKPISLMADRYVQALQRVTPLTEQINFYRERFFSSRTYDFAPAVASQFKLKADDYLEASTVLKQRVETLDLEQRRQQIKLLETRLGKDIHWYLLAYMIQAKDTLNLVSEGVKNRSLTPQALAKTTEDLQRAWDSGQPFLRPQFAQSDRDKVPIYLYSEIARPTQQYLKALGTLHKDWQNKAQPQRLSDDFYTVTRSYDALISYYNRLARAEY
ncbi:DUF3829 domain-containing protein [Pseudomonas sp. PD9R]|uniref:DUF3829 domain-containing protein n=1 Tax=Pseudomonas sp. PD9R TaxID=2853534 RepID=UPI001C4745BA|nr:DUF3829 domain-containing protein [Pseudomonas sp. PD9R]MBV6822938.1 YiiG family protein [Pseudomonas sp. PD9R]